MADIDFSTVTELPGTKVSMEQVQRAVNRYCFAAEFCRDKDVLDLACGTGIGLGVLKASARSLVAGDIDQGILDSTRRTHGNSIDCRCLDAQDLPFDENSFDVIILFEAIYYLQQPERFAREARRVLRDNGTIIVCNPNKDLADFNPSPFSHRYFNAPEFRELFEPMGFDVRCYGDSPVSPPSVKSRAFSWLKRIAVKLDLIPQTMKGKVLLKRIVFGKLTAMPISLAQEKLETVGLTPIPEDVLDERYKVLFCVARLPKERSGRPAVERNH